MQTATVIKSEPKREFDGQHGKMYVHWIELDNGDKGEYLSKQQVQDKFIVGQSANYTIENKPFASKQTGEMIDSWKIKPHKENNYGGGGKDKKNYLNEYTLRDKLIVKQSSLKAAVEMMDKVDIPEGVKATDVVLQIAEKFQKWVEG